MDICGLVRENAGGAVALFDLDGSGSVKPRSAFRLRISLMPLSIPAPVVPTSPSIPTQDRSVALPRQSRDTTLQQPPTSLWPASS